jgi:ABC-type transport system involved in cytochrome c biogenesis permease subunit
MTWYNFPFFVYISVGLWIVGALLMLLPKKYKKECLFPAFAIAGTAALAIFTIGLWITLERPIFRTLGETRLWYALFISLLGIIIYYRWKYWWMLLVSVGMATLFLLINLSHPEVFDKTMPPALQSPWFIPHVIVYIIGYVLLGVSSLIGIIGLIFNWRSKPIDKIVKMADNIVYLGFAFLTFGLLFGALWAKEAWGSYWTWDPKETWSFLTWMVYLLYIHFRVYKKESIKTALWILALSFVILLICWFGINYLPSAQNSVHVYSQG